MKKTLNVKNIGLLIVMLVLVLTISTRKVKAVGPGTVTGTVTWDGPSSVTIRETIRNIANPIVASREYFIVDEDSTPAPTTATISYTASDTPTNYQITKSTTMNLSSLTFTKPGDYEYYFGENDLRDLNGNYLYDYIDLTNDCPAYRVTISVRNIVNANNVPTGNFTATMILEKGTYNEQTEEVEIEKVSPDSGVLYADTYFETVSESFGHIELSKTVKGIGADTTKYFPFTININNDPTTGTYTYPLDTSGWTYPITGIDATVTYNGNTITNPTTITNGTPTTIYLKHGQTAIIGQVTSGGNTFDAIPIGRCQGTYNTNPYHGSSGGVTQSAYDYSKTPDIKRLASIDGGTCYGSYYTIEENYGDYAPSFKFGNNDTVSEYYVYARGVNSTSNTVDFYNEKEMSPVTGLIFTILPYVIIIGIGVGGTLLVIRLKKEERKVKE